MRRQPVPISLVIARIVAVTGLGFCAAFSVFLLLGGAWVVGLAFLAAAVVFLSLMFIVERGR
jgi:hypothetical protein